MSGLHLTPVTGRDRLAVAPLLPAELEGQLAAMRPSRFPGAGPDDPGMTIAGSLPEYQPLAARYVLVCDDLLEPASRDLIEDWLLTLLAGIPGRGADETKGAAWTVAAVVALGDMPGAVWCQETLKQAALRFVFWPAVAELHALLEPHAARLRRMRRDLQAIADAPRDRQQGPPGKSTEPYDPGPAPEWATTGPSKPKPAEEPIEIDRAAIDEQLASMGISRSEAAGRGRERPPRRREAG